MTAPHRSPPDEWHRAFAPIANNRAWALSEFRANSDNDEELLNAAHTAAWHWKVIGKELHHMRALVLLAQVHAQVGHGKTAFAYAEKVQRYFLARAETPDWELACVHTIHAHAALVAGHAKVHAVSYRAATEALAAIKDPQDHEIVLRTYRQIPAPTIDEI